MDTTCRASQLLREHQLRIYSQTDRIFAVLLAVQWVAGIAAAFWVSPRTWSGQSSATHLHVWAAIYLGGAIALFPIALIVTRSGSASTRYVIAVAQMLTSSLLVQLTGGRIETHFHVFGSLAFLSFYRDWRVLVPATIVVAGDHFIRGIYWPQSVFGVLTASEWRWLEHAGWVIFEDIFLVAACVRSHREMQDIAERSAELEASEQRYRAVMEQAAEGICLLDSETKEVLECNAALRRLLGSSGTPTLQIGEDTLSPGQLAIQESMVPPQTGDPVVPCECQYVRPDGSLVALSITVNRIIYGSRQVLCAVVRDVTERQRAQHALRHSEERYALAAMGANDGLWDWDFTSGKVYLSPRCREMLGLGDDTDSDISHWFSRIHIDDRGTFDAALGEHLEGRTAHFQHEHRIFTVTAAADGSCAAEWPFVTHPENRREWQGRQTDITTATAFEEQLQARGPA